MPEKVHISEKAITKIKFGFYLSRAWVFGLKLPFNNSVSFLSLKMQIEQFRRGSNQNFGDFEATGGQCFLSSLPLLPYYPYFWTGFVGAKKKTSVGSLSIYFLDVVSTKNRSRAQDMSTTLQVTPHLLAHTEQYTDNLGVLPETEFMKGQYKVSGHRE
jgi:hypothetical protein